MGADVQAGQIRCLREHLTHRVLSYLSQYSILPAAVTQAV